MIKIVVYNQDNVVGTFTGDNTFTCSGDSLIISNFVLNRSVAAFARGQWTFAEAVR